jgi:hypothetical protein
MLVSNHLAKAASYLKFGISHFSVYLLYLTIGYFRIDSNALFFFATKAKLFPSISSRITSVFNFVLS